jgi:hypothetical protein
LDESEVLNDVNSDITSSLIAGNGAKADQQNAKAKATPKTQKKKAEDAKVDDAKGDQQTTQPKTPETSKAKKTKTPNSESNSKLPLSTDKKSKSSGATNSGKKPPKSKKASKSKTEDTDKQKATKTDDSSGVASNENPSPKPPPSPSLFMNLGCGFVDTFTTNVAGVCHFGSKPEGPTEVPPEDDTGGSFISGSSANSTQLTALEKAVWTDWDKKEENFDKNWDCNKPDKKWECTKTLEQTFEKKEEHDKKREVARGKLLDIASSALSSQQTEQPSSDYTEDCSSGSSDSDGSSGDSGESGVTGSTTENGHGSNTGSYYSVTDSEFVSDAPSVPDKLAKQPVTTPILLSFSQRSLIEKFSKQLATDGVEVLKLNRRKQWQARYFTVSKEQIALIAHEAKSKSGEVTQCPKALLWLKKFNAKSGGYGITTIDKNGHGGMLLVDLVDVHVSTATAEQPIPKRLLEKYKNSVLVTLDYTMDGGNRSVEFRCKDNDEAQFLCTCMRVIRDLLKREEALRQKSLKEVSAQ